MNKFNKSLVLLFLSGIILFFVSKGNFAFATLVPLALLAFRLLTVRGPLIYWAMFAEFALLTVPVSSMREFSLAFLLQLLFVGGEILNQLAGKEKLNFPKSSKWLFVFILLLAVTAKVRGFGLYSLGGSSIGGMEYIIFGTRIAFIAFSIAYANTYKMDIKKLYRFVLVGTLVYFTFNMIVYFVPATTGFITQFCDVMFAGGGSEVVAERIAAGQTSARRVYSLYYVPFALMPYVMKQPKLNKRILFGAGCLLLAAMSGFRTALVIIGTLFLFSEWIMYKVDFSKVILFGVLLVLFLGVSWIVLPSMDARIQRAYTVVPGFKSRVPAMVSLSAESSDEWRIKLYGVCLRNLPKYLLVGRGLGDDLSVVYDRVVLQGGKIMTTEESAEMAFAMHAYHLAVFELLIEYGAVAGSVFLIGLFILLRQGRLRLRVLGGRTSKEEKYALACLAAMLTGTMTYFSSFSAGFLNMVMYGAVALACIRHGVIEDGDSANHAS